MTSLTLMFLVVGLAINLGNVQALSNDDKENIHAGILPFIVECSKEYGVTEEQIKEAKESGQADSFDPCLIGCIFKKIGVIDDKGLFNPDKSEELTKKVLPNEDDQKKALEFIDSCKSVNDEDVSDGEKGCDRAKLLYECFAPIRDEFVKAS
ncbi:unnamed protein product [Euphydryas editha]|uniref:Uncharacterized protein n=1 Tax=Euphydryas editha TaxID=104508 RepID=A0AAU9TVI5_EUPED|nr:unnamed protein product [Euphydryas editha]